MGDSVFSELLASVLVIKQINYIIHCDLQLDTQKKLCAFYVYLTLSNSHNLTRLEFYWKSNSKM